MAAYPFIFAANLFTSADLYLKAQIGQLEIPLFNCENRRSFGSHFARSQTGDNRIAAASLLARNWLIVC